MGVCVGTALGEEVSAAVEELTEWAVAAAVEVKEAVTAVIAVPSPAGAEDAYGSADVLHSQPRN